MLQSRRAELADALDSKSSVCPSWHIRSLARLRTWATRKEQKRLWYGQHGVNSRQAIGEEKANELATPKASSESKKFYQGVTVALVRAPEGAPIGFSGP